MDKAIIFGIYNFVSFHMGRTLLNKGLEVIGLHIGEAPSLEEKRLEVGRNANFKEISLSQLDAYREDDTAKTTLIISLYDVYMLNTETILQKQTVTSLEQYIEKNKNLTDIIFILPIQLLISNEALALRTFIEHVIAWPKKNRFYYLPAIYGPWQPSVFTFQQALMAKRDDSVIRASKREWTGDILFVDDAVEAILASIENSDAVDNMNFLIESGKENYWLQCAEQLKLDKVIIEGVQSEQLEIDKTIKRVSVKRVTPFSNSIEEQIEIVKRLI
ncbi:hypothetical protein COJ85_07625 [Bacillus sp. AFS076308]|uniref:hypothetical protein n=1 Tax=unclassified Bacillus (in: firmicutes) TaxID=185979 RepID=UPI000BF4100F|nr:MULTISPECIES: hypothetical protein [unclassified Bacillus (in: firmicutes)]PFO06200.1 hypothetical protein COJ85_07625 [Bacillus sp. AFS076308]PGV48008.1 hypothetical protein COD92_27950 [Bacillus sp. AFS037270]